MATELYPAPDEPVERVQALITDVLAVTPDDIDQDLLESGLLDSMGLIELLFAIEQAFGVELPLEDLDVNLLKSVRGIASYVNELPSS